MTVDELLARIDQTLAHCDASQLPPMPDEPVHVGPVHVVGPDGPEPADPLTQAVMGRLFTAWRRLLGRRR